MSLRILLLRLVTILGLIGGCLWMYWALLWQQLTILHLHIIGTGPYYALGIRLEIFFWVFIVSLVWISLVDRAYRDVRNQLVRVLVGATAIAMSAVLINQGLVTSRGVIFQLGFYLVGSILSFEAVVLLNMSRGQYVTAPAPARISAAY